MSTLKNYTGSGVCLQLKAYSLPLPCSCSTWGMFASLWLRVLMCQMIIVINLPPGAVMSFKWNSRCQALHSVFHKEKHSVNVIKNHLEEGLWKWIWKYIEHALEGERPSIKRAQEIVYQYDFEKSSSFLKILFSIAMFFLDLCLSSVVIPCLCSFSPWFSSLFFFWIWHKGKDKAVGELMWLSPCQPSSTTNLYPSFA